MTDVVLVEPPFASLERPSLALGLITGALEDNLSCNTIYANLLFAEMVGVAEYSTVAEATPSDLIGSLIFSQTLKAGHTFETEEIRKKSKYLARPLVELLIAEGHYSHSSELLSYLLNSAQRFTLELAEYILSMNPRVVGVSSMFDQHSAALGLLAAVKRLNPSIVTVIGGANVAAEMGRETHHNYPFVDFTVTGEFDNFFKPFFKAAVSGEILKSEVAELPPNLLGPQHRIESLRDFLPEVWTCENLDETPIPNYSRYFETLEQTSFAKYVSPTLLFETSRGCWWGQKKHCTFCGLNSTGMTYRKKSAQRALEEIQTLSKKHRLYRGMATDNIIDLSYFKTVLPELVNEKPQIQLFYETKSNLSSEQVKLMADAGCVVVQPGIESLHDETLKIMRKGTTAAQNIYLLKNALHFGVLPIWSVLCGFPKSDPEWVWEVAKKFDALSHLPPPNSIAPIRFDRFSPYHFDREEFGLTIKPMPQYSEIFGLSEKSLQDFSYFFERELQEPEIHYFADKARLKVNTWREQFWSARRPKLEYQLFTKDKIVIHDTRAISKDETVTLHDDMALILYHLEKPSKPRMLQQAVIREGSEVNDLETRLNILIESGFVWKSDSGQLISLVTHPTIEKEIRPELDLILGKTRARQSVYGRRSFLHKLAER